MAANDLKDDIKELQCLLDLAQRPKIKDVLTVQIRKWQSDLIHLQEEQQKKESPADGEKTEEKTESKPAPVKPAAEKTTVKQKDIRQYAWDQSDKFMKLYVDVPGVHTVPEANVTSHFQTRYVKVSAIVGNTVYNVAVGPFHSDIITGDSKCKVKTNKLLIMLKKEKEKETWANVVAKQSKKKKSPPAADDDDNKDPNESLMTMLKQMYDDGDDEMKRTIAKSFYQSQHKKKDDDKEDKEDMDM